MTEEPHSCDGKINHGRNDLQPIPSLILQCLGRTEEQLTAIVEGRMDVNAITLD